MAWLERGEGGQGETWYQLVVCLRTDTWRFWEPCSAAQMMVLDNVISDSQGEEYAWGDDGQYRKDCFYKTWQEPFTTWYLVYLYDVGPEAVPEWVDMTVYWPFDVWYDGEKVVVTAEGERTGAVFLFRMEETEEVPSDKIMRLYHTTRDADLPPYTLEFFSGDGTLLETVTNMT